MGAAFAYDTYTNPSKNNGVLRATLTAVRRFRPFLCENHLIKSLLAEKIFDVGPTF